MICPKEYKTSYEQALALLESLPELDVTGDKYTDPTRSELHELEYAVDMLRGVVMVLLNFTDVNDCCRDHELRALHIWLAKVESYERRISVCHIEANKDALRRYTTVCSMLWQEWRNIEATAERAAN